MHGSETRIGVNILCNQEKLRMHCVAAGIGIVMERGGRASMLKTAGLMLVEKTGEVAEKAVDEAADTPPDVAADEAADDVAPGTRLPDGEAKLGP